MGFVLAANEILAELPIWALKHVPVGLFIFMFGACAGSFLNVVNYRIPAGLSITTPASRCPSCQTKLKFFTENLPILGWLWLRGKCRHCSVRISPEYVLAELFVGLAFLGVYLAYFATPVTMDWWGDVGGPWWRANDVLHALPMFVAHLFLVGGLFSMTVIDLRTFTIPIEVTASVTLVGFAAALAQGWTNQWMPAAQPWAFPLPEWPLVGLAIGGIAGVCIGLGLLRFGILRYSFHDYEKYVEEGEILGEYPHARREMLIELAFLLPCGLGMALGWFAGEHLAASEAALPLPVQSLGGAMLGYLVGGGLVWGVRILGTLGFGREAMGMGDVHLLAAVGAVLGWCDPVRIFFIAPFFGLLWALFAATLGSTFKIVDRQLPYGPHLALATVVVVLCRPGVDWIWGTFLGLPCG